MKKLLFSLVMMAFAVSAMNAQAVVAPQTQKECCKDHKDGQKCDKPADQQCPDCKAKAAKQECKEGQKCEKAQGMKHECKDGQKCEKAQGMKHECKEGKKCDKPADQQCPDCKEKAKKN